MVALRLTNDYDYLSDVPIFDAQLHLLTFPTSYCVLNTHNLGRKITPFLT